MANDLWDRIHAERDAFADDVSELTEREWNVDSLCPGWTVRDVLAHQTTAAIMTPPAFFMRLAAAGFSFDKYTNNQIARYRGDSPQDALRMFRAAAHRTTAPPGPKVTWLGEAIVHSEDIRKPLGIRHEYKTRDLEDIAGFYSGSNLLIGSKKRIKGFRFQATDSDWATGEGKLVRGRLLALVMSMTGRKAFIGELEGDGVSELSERG